MELEEDPAKSLNIRKCASHLGFSLDMHDYGNTSLIGARGQSVDDYLSNMHSLFLDCYHISTLDATVWLVVGSVRRNKRLILLPELLTSITTTV